MSKRRTSEKGTAISNSKEDAASGLFKAALKQHRAGSYEDAELLYRNVIAENPSHASALSNLGVLARRKRRLSEAISYYRRAIAADPNVASTHHNLGNALIERGLTEAAQSSFREALRLNPDYVDARVGLASTLLGAGETTLAIEELKRVLVRDKNHVGALAMLGRTLLQRRDYDGAIPYLMRTIEIEPSHAEALNNMGCILSDRGRKADAKIYFERAVKAAENQAASHLNLGNMIRDLEGPRAAIPHYRRATELSPTYVKAWFNLGSALTRIDRDASVRSLREVLKLQPGHVGALICCLMDAEKVAAFDAADEYHERLVAALTEQVADYQDWNILGNVLYNCIFRPVGAELEALISRRIELLLLEQVKRYGPLPPLDASTRPANEKVRVGFISPNFRDHPVGHVTLSLFRSLDRSRFEVHGFSTDTSSDRFSFYAVEHRKGFDVFHHLGGLSPRDSALAIREAGIDILIDLDGYMDNKSPPILAFRPARIQVYWLGHAGGLGLGFVDYLLADATVVPDGEQALYREKVVRLPEVYHPADRAPISDQVPNRSEFGLNEEGFVFCAFNNPQKIDQRVFDSWLRILGQVEGSLLWLSDPRSDGEMVANLKSYAERAGIAPERIVFSSRIPDKAVHLGRHRHAGLFLDTVTLNASTTALDALWVDLPLLTVKGSRFSSRISTTMLTCLGLGEMVAQDLTEYEQRAISYAKEPEQLRNLAEKFATARDKMPLFDAQRFARHLELAIEKMWQTYELSQSPSAFDVPVIPSSVLHPTDTERQPTVERNYLARDAAEQSQGTSTIVLGDESALRLHIGGRQKKAGYRILNVQSGPDVDYVGNCVDLTQFADESVDEIYASHVYEHLGFRVELPRALREAWRVLKPSGILRMSVPDLERLCKLFVHPDVPKDQKFSLMMHLFGAQEDPYDFHRVGLTQEFLFGFLKQAGFVRMRRVDEFKMFNDYSSYRRFGVLISLNIEAYKQ